VTSGRELGVQTVLEGSLQKLGDRVRVTVQLISVSDGRPLWAEQFDEKFTDIFAVQDKISERITNALSLRLTGNERQLLAKRYTENTEAYLRNVMRSKAFLAHAYAVAGRIAEANKIEKELQELASTQYVSSYDIALIYAGLGETNQALASLEKAYAEGDPPLNHIAVEPRFDTLRVEPRFRDLLRRMHLAL
jgi:tetratricopeptide (TPR) repeat protein